MKSILLIVLICVSYVLHIITFPFIISYKFIDVLFPALFVSGFFSVIFYFLQVKLLRSNKKVRSFFITLPVFFTSYFFTGLVCAENYIESVANSKYGLKPESIDINFGKWTYFAIIGDGYRGHVHAYICLEGSKYNWSFDQRDFYDAKTTFMCSN